MGTGRRRIRRDRPAAFEMFRDAPLPGEGRKDRTFLGISLDKPWEIAYNTTVKAIFYDGPLVRGIPVHHFGGRENECLKSMCGRMSLWKAL